MVITANYFKAGETTEKPINSPDLLEELDDAVGELGVVQREALGLHEELLNPSLQGKREPVDDAGDVGEG